MTSLSCEMLVCQQTAVSEDDKDLWRKNDNFRAINEKSYFALKLIAGAISNSYRSLAHVSMKTSV